MGARTHRAMSFMTLILLLVCMATAAVPLAAQGALHAKPVPKAEPGASDIVRDPSDVPPPIANRAPTVVHVTLTTQEVFGQLDPSTATTYRYWTFGGKVPGPMIRVRQGDTVEVTLRNDSGSHMVHSVDFHAALGPGGGAAFSQAVPGQSKMFTFQATTPGLFFYHCGTPMVAEHIANGMYGLILVEPEGGLPHVDHEYYVMQGEIYTTAPKGKTGLQQYSNAKLMDEMPEYFVFNGAVDSLTKKYSLHANVGETIRLFFGDAGPNAASSLHVVGEIFTRDYVLGSLMSPPLAGIQTASVPPGSGAILELVASVPGQFIMVDHAMARMAKGLSATLEVTGAENSALMHPGPPLGLRESTPLASGMSPADTAAGISGDPLPHPTNVSEEGVPDPTHAMVMHEPTAKMGHAHESVSTHSRSSSTIGGSGPSALNGCLTLLDNGRVMLKDAQSNKTYRLEARPLLFSENANRFVHVTGGLGSVVAVEDPNIPSFVVDTVLELAPTCSTRLTPALLRKALTKATKTDAVLPLTVLMGDITFMPAKIVVKVGQKVTWKNSSAVIHNVIDDAGKALNVADVHVPAGGAPFDSGFMQPGQTFARVFTVPGA